MRFPGWKRLRVKGFVEAGYGVDRDSVDVNEVLRAPALTETGGRHADSANKQEAQDQE